MLLAKNCPCPRRARTTKQVPDDSQNTRNIDLEVCLRYLHEIMAITYRLNAQGPESGGIAKALSSLTEAKQHLECELGGMGMNPCNTFQK